MSKMSAWFLDQEEAGNIQYDPRGIDMSRFKLTKKVPPPEAPDPSPDIKSTLDSMEIGHSFSIKNLTEKQQAAVRQKLTRYQDKYPPKRFSMRKNSINDVRIWRVEDYK